MPRMDLSGPGDGVDKPAGDVSARLLDEISLPTLNWDTYWKPHALDAVRPEFMTGVLTPILHATWTKTMIELRAAGFMDHLRDRRDEFRGANAGNLIDAIGEQIGQKLGARAGEPLMLNDAQYIAAVRFSSLGDPTYQQTATVRELAFLAGTVGRTIQEIITRHPQLASSDTLVAFLRSPECPPVLRTVAAGGNGFADSLRGKNNSSYGAPWRHNRHKPYLVIAPSGKISPSREILEAAMEMRANNPSIDRPYWLSHGLVRAALRHSAGCPGRTLIVNPRTDNLVRLGLALTEEQLSQLCGGKDPALISLGDGRYRVARDAYAETCLFLADAIEAMTAK